MPRLRLAALVLPLLLGLACEPPRRLAGPPPPRAPLGPAPAFAARTIVLEPAAPAAPAAIEIDTLAYARIEADVTYLASPGLAGRATGEPGARTTVEYIRSRYQQLGLRPAGDVLQPIRRGAADPSSGGPPSPNDPVHTYFQSFEANTGTQEKPVMAGAWNVLGALPARQGSPHASEWVVIGAHHDHLGKGNQHARPPLPPPKAKVTAEAPPAPTVTRTRREPYLGADDNASGTALLLEVARRLAQLPERPPRNILFAAWGAEELGLVGSRWFVEHPTVPFASITAMVNADMVGRLRDRRLYVDGTATAAGLSDLVAAAAAGLRLSLTFGPQPDITSDHAPFIAAKVPAAFLFTGMHDDYHRPSDTADRLDMNGIAVLSVLAARLVSSLAGLDARLSFVPPPAPAPAPAPAPSQGKDPAPASSPP